jgi:hypothetical protein
MAADLPSLPAEHVALLDRIVAAHPTRNALQAVEELDVDTNARRLLVEHVSLRLRGAAAYWSGRAMSDAQVHIAQAIEGIGTAALASVNQLAREDGEALAVISGIAACLAARQLQAEALGCVVSDAQRLAHFDALFSNHIAHARDHVRAQLRKTFMEA